MRIEIDEDQGLPGIHFHGDEAIVLAFEILYAFEFGHAFERTVETVVPSVIGTMQDRCLSAGLGHDCRGVMAAHIVKSSQDAVVSAHGYQRLSGNRGGHKLAGLFDLVYASDHLPRLAENSMPFQFGDTRVDVPWRGNGIGIG